MRTEQIPVSGDELEAKLAEIKASGGMVEAMDAGTPTNGWYVLSAIFPESKHENTKPK